VAAFPTPAVDAAIQYWIAALRESRTAPPNVPVREEKIELFAQELRRVLRGDCHTPYGQMVANQLPRRPWVELETTKDGYPQHILAEAAMNAGFTREFIAFPPNRRVRVHRDGRIEELDADTPIPT
jgi:hypothetical protein